MKVLPIIFFAAFLVTIILLIILITIIYQRDAESGEQNQPKNKLGFIKDRRKPIGQKKNIEITPVCKEGQDRT